MFTHVGWLLLLLQLSMGMDPFDLTDTDFNSPLNLIWNNRPPATSLPTSGNILDTRGACTVTDGQTRDGTCMNAAQCRINRGRSGARASCGFWNTCCVFEKSSGQTTSARISYFTNPQNSRQVTPVHRMFVKLANRNVCQMRIDIIDMELTPATTTPPPPGTPASTSCRSDMFFVEPALTDVRVPDICGTQTNQHFYVHLNSNQMINNGIILNVRLEQSTGPPNTATLVEPHWIIKVTQLECPTRTRGIELQGKETRNQIADDLSLLAPLGCLQYFTEPSGTVTNFGFNTLTDSAFNSNQDYAICFRRWPYTCGIQMSYDFLQLHGTAGATPSCVNEYIYIPEIGSPSAATGTTPPTPTQCIIWDPNQQPPPPPPRPPTVFTSTHPGPYYLHVHSDATAPADATADVTHGFRFTYTPINCSN